MRLANHEVSDPAELRILTAGLDVGAQVPLVFYREGADADGQRQDQRTAGRARDCLSWLPRSGSSRRRGQGPPSRSIR